MLKQTVDRRVVGLAPGQPTYRLLIVDDKWNNRRLLGELLAPLGFELQEAENGRLRRIRKRLNRFHISRKI